MEVLVCLAQHAGETLSKEKLLQTVWRDTFVSEDALKHSISDLRRVFEDDAREPRVIQTIAKRGYRLLPPVEPVNGIERSKAAELPTVNPNQTAGRPAIGRPMWWAGAVVIGAVISMLAVLIVFRGSRSARANSLPVIHSLAVLPLQNLSADPAQEYFSDGMTDALITDLAQIGSVKVISRTSIMRYKKSEKSLPEIARELGVDGIVEGTVQRSGDRVRVTAQLIHGSLDKHLWANTYDGDVHDTLALESNITEDIARHVQERITPAQATQLGQPKRIDAKVLEAFLQGTYHLEHFGRGGGVDEYAKAAEYFQQAIDADPIFAPAYVGLARTHIGLLWPSKKDGEIARAAAARAVALDPNLSEAHAVLGQIDVDSWKWQAAEEEYRRGIAINPNSAEAHAGLGNLLLMLGRLKEGYPEYEIAQTLDPNSDSYSDVLEIQGQFDRAIDRELMLLKRNPDDGYHHLELVKLYSKKGMYKEAYLQLNQTAVLFDFPIARAQARHLQVVSDYRGAIRELLRGFEQMIAAHQLFTPVNLADIYAALGDKERAFYWLEQAYAQHDERFAAGDLGLERLNMEYLLDPLRSDPRFKDLVRRVGLPQVQIDEPGSERRTTLIRQ
jgi:TolB-like protein/Tfp pilus assembly protein PilF